MKKLFNGLLVIAATMIFASCGSDKSTTDTTITDSATDHMSADTSMGNMNMSPGVDLTGTAGPSNFVSHAASGGMMEVELGKVAQQNASSKDVKDLATMIREDHQKANEELKKIASSKSITVPAAMMSDHQSHVTDMSAKKGADFDRAYVDMMVTDHSKDIEMFKNASAHLTDPDLKAFADKTLPVLEKHLAKSKEVQAKLQ